MGSRHREDADDTSIKPVSSLRSHFERISHHGHLPHSPQRSKTPDSLPRTPPASDTHHYERSSIDISSTRTPPGHSNVFDSHGHRHSTLNPATQPARSLPVHSLKHSQPPPAHALVSPRYSPPQVTVQSPVSPLRINGTIQGVLATSAPVDWSVVENQPDQRPRSSEPTLAPVPNRATKPGWKAQSINRPGCRTSISESSFGSRMTPTIHRNSRAENTQQRLEAHSATINARISPFSTPPSSDDSLDGNVVGRMTPSEDLDSSGQGPETRSPQTAKPPFLQASGKVEGTGQPERQRSLAIGLAPHLQEHTSAQSTLEQRPALPPRPGVAPRYPSVEVQRAPVFTSSNGSKGSKGGFEPRQPIHTVDPIEQQSHPVRISRHTPGLNPLRPPTRMSAAGTSAMDQPLRAAYSKSDTVHHEANQLLTRADYNPDISVSKTGSSTTEGLDGFHSNRRPPRSTTGNQVIHANYDTKLFDMCAGRTCSAGQLIRVWDLSSGRLILSLALGEREVRATAVTFKLASKTDEEGSRLWVGTNHGDLHEIDIATHKVVSSRPNAHNGREVVRIHRYQNAMWTLDEDGSLYVWPPRDSGLPTLQSRPVTRKLPRGHTFSIVIRGMLWLAVGKDLQIFYPSTDEHEEFKPAQQPSSQASVGEITSGAVIGDQLDKVYFGHNDGKITTYSVTDYTCLGVVNASVYKINCLIGAGAHLWAGYNTGKICVYDTQLRPWKLMKEWHAHEGPVTNLSVDRTGLWVSGLLRVGSVSLDNTIKVWDGLLEEDWIETEMQDNDGSWCSFQEIEAVVMTWNAGASTPASLRYEEKESNMLRLILPPGKTPDLLVFGFQELVDLEDKRITAKTLFKGPKRKDANDQDHMSRQYRDWRDYLVRSIEDHMPMNETYSLLHTASMVGLFSCVFVKATQRSRISNVHATEIKRGMGGLHGNKGALILRFNFDDTSICSVNCHLAAGQTQTMHRNNDVTAILESLAFPSYDTTTTCSNYCVGGGDGSMILDHEICILNGDLNYRIDTMSRDIVIKAIQSGNLAKLLERDQLLVSRRKTPTFGLKAFAELPIQFDPTYKYDIGSNTYDSSEKHRAPAWCDRILYRGPDNIKQLHYRRHELRASDHRPVSGDFRIRVKTILPDKREKVLEECQQRFQLVRSRLEKETKIQYLRDVLGLSAEEARGLIQTQPS